MTYAHVTPWAQALEAAPQMTTYVLNLVHTLEVCNKYREFILPKLPTGTKKATHARMDACPHGCMDAQRYARLFTYLVSV